ncbi:MAG: hypothetical protein ACERK6_06380 [Candidatus Aminicenantaceae bacterium]
MKKGTALLLIMFCFAFWPLHAEEEKGNLENTKIDIQDLKKHAPFVFLDCWRCDKDFIRTEITFVNYVRVRQDSDIHILVTEQRNGAGGYEYTMEFIGRRQFEGMGNTVTYNTMPTDTSDDARRKMVDNLKKGLFPFLMQTPLAEYLSVAFKQRLKPTSVDDPWNFWVFYVSASGRLDGEESRQYNSIRGNFSANRITPEWKIRFGVNGNFDESNFEYDEETIQSKSERQRASGMVVKSISDHWSVGGWAGWTHSTYSNQNSVWYLAPAIEYNIFPYHESTRRQLRILYRVGLTYNNYIEETIYNKTQEQLLSQTLSAVFEVKEPWGNASASLEGSNYFHDFSKNRLRMNGYVNFRLVRGLSLTASGGYSRIHDQLGLRKGDATIDEVLLRRTELATDYDYNLSLGVSYTFGSVYSNVVNPRFGR